MFLGLDTIYRDSLLWDSMLQHCRERLELLSIPQGQPIDKKMANNGQIHKNPHSFKPLTNKKCTSLVSTNLCCTSGYSIPLVICTLAVFRPLPICHPAEVVIELFIKPSAWFHIKVSIWCLRKEPYPTTKNEYPSMWKLCTTVSLFSNMISMKPLYVPLMRDLSIRGGPVSGRLGKSSL